MSEEFRESPFPEFKKSGPAPWEAIQELARRLSTNPELLNRAVEQFDYLIDVGPWEEMDCEFIYLCAVLALAAPTFSTQQRAKVLASMGRAVEELEGCGDLAEESLHSALASFQEPGYEESRPVQQWVEDYSTAFELWCKSMEEEMDLFGQGDNIFGDDDEDAEGEEDEEGEEGEEERDQ